MAVWPDGGTNVPTVTSEFDGARRNPVTGVVQPHNGIDLVGWDVVRAPISGTIVFAGYNGGAGNEVRIQGDNGDGIRLLHNRAFIRTGGHVNEGEPVAYMGTTGQSTGKHCHYETHPGGFWNAVNPRGYMAGRTGSPANVGGGQRTVGPNGVKRRSQPTSQSAEAGEALAPGVVGNFDGWVHGENVEGNDVWYRGISGNWFWSGAFREGANGTGLADLNAPSMNAQQRQAGGNGVRRRVGSPSTSAPEGEMLAPGTVGNFRGWVNGQVVDGNPVWFVGISGDYFWSGGFTSTSRDGLEDLNPKTPTPEAPSTQRTAGPNGVRRRSLPSSQSAEAGEMLAAGVVGNFDAWTKGEAVDGNAVWFRGISGNWFWSGGFTSQSTAGLTEVAAPTTPSTPTPTPDPKPTGDPDNPRGLPKVTPVYPGAAFGLEAPLGVGASRSTKGTPPVAVPQVGIDRFIVHHTAATADQLDWFSYANARSVAPTWYLRTSGQLIELIRPGLKPAATGPEWNYRSVAVETQNETGAPEWKVTDAQVEALAQAVAWLASYDGKTLDGTPVRFKIDRTHVIGHGEAAGQSTECPGPYLRPRLDDIVARARVIYQERYSTPETPQEPGGDDDTVPVPRGWLQSILDRLKGLLGGK